MQLVSFEVQSSLGPKCRIGILDGGAVVDANLAYRRLLERTGQSGLPARVADAILPTDMLTLLETGAIAWDALKAVAEASAQPGFLDTADDGAQLRWDVSRVKLLAPLPVVRSMRECGLYEGHASRMGKTGLPEIWYQMPIYWKGNPNAIQGPDSVIDWPVYTSQLDYELEIALVIGKKGINIDRKDAMSYVAGFTIFNDVTARDQMWREVQIHKGPSKSKDFCNVFGPALVTPDEVDPSRFEVEVRINGERRTKTETSAMNFSWGELIEYISRDEYLFPGDILTGGTVTGCSISEHFGKDYTGPLLNPGDLIEFEVQGLGTLRNRVSGLPAGGIIKLGRELAGTN